jgi:acyl-CoA synthetase (AMP-forming)/AMP-acid ligase II
MRSRLASRQHRRHKIPVLISPNAWFFPCTRQLRLLATRTRQKRDGAATRTSFDAVAGMSRRLANVLKADGLVHGDRVAVGRQSQFYPNIAQHWAHDLGLNRKFEDWTPEYGWWLEK